MVPAVLTLVVKACLVFLLLLFARVLWWIVKTFVIAPWFDPLKNLPGPDGSLFENHMVQVMNSNISADTTDKWVKEYGRTFRFHGFGKCDYRFMSFDFRAVSHILTSPNYEKPWQTRKLLSTWFGQGVFSAEGAEHKQQRKLIAPAFTAPSVRALTPIFFQKAEELRDRWDSQISQDQDEPGTEPGQTTLGPADVAANAIIDVSHWVARATFDVVGLAGFDYHFHSLRGESEELYLAYRRMFNAIELGVGIRSLLYLQFPLLEKLWPDERAKVVNSSHRVIHRTGKYLVDDKKAMILASKSSPNDIHERDILSLLIKSNLSSDPSKRLSDSGLLEQISTFLFAGSDSTSLAIAYCLHYLSLHPEIQTRLRNELSTLPVDRKSPSPDPLDWQSAPSTAPSPTRQADALDDLPFLDSVIRETLRMCPPVHSTIRVPVADDLIPISQPVRMRDGTVVPAGGYIPIRKNTYIHIPIEGLNLCEDIWGKDARVFNPDRWENLPPTARAPMHPGLANLMTFSFGPHSCIGTKFSIAEIKVFVATLVPHFVFEPVERIATFSAVLTRPYVSKKYPLGSKLPLKVKRYVG